MSYFIKILIVFLLFPFGLFAQDNHQAIMQGKGSFIVDGGTGRESLKLTVSYNLPRSFTPDSPVLIVLPGSGRTADKYRDRWVAASEQYGILVLSVAYSKRDYPKSANYNLARMVKVKEGHFSVVKTQSEWTFSDLDRVFELAVSQTGSRQKYYDVFGHSAGGQYLHRLALFYPSSKAKRILSANSGWYTTTDFETDFPYGLANGPFDKVSMQRFLKASFSKNLVVFLGEKDDRNETQGSLRRGHDVDKQGLSRIERGRYFYANAKRYAESNNLPFNWKLHVVKEVGHSGTLMSQAGARYLYSNK